MSLWDRCLRFCFQVLPFRIDSRWRRTEYSSNRNHRYRPALAADDKATIRRRSRHHTSAFTLFIFVLWFVAYGPTPSAVCGAGEAWFIRVVWTTLTGAVLAIVIYFIARAFEAEHPLGRRGKTLVFLLLTAIAVGLPSVAVSLRLFDSFCPVAVEQRWQATAQFIAMLGFFFMAFSIGRRAVRTSQWIRLASALIIALALVCFLLAPDDGTEGEAVPYLHVYGVLAALLYAIPLLAPYLAQSMLGGFSAQSRRDFKRALGHVDLFVNRPGVSRPTGIRIWHALVNGPLNHPVQLLILPALVTLTVPDRWLGWAIGAALVFSGLLLMWSALETRWQHMVAYVDRWLCTGTPLVVSIGVIVVAGLRLDHNPYVEPIVTAAPFGIVSAWVVMLYALFWLFEHLINQALGLKLLNLVAAPGDVVEDGFIRYRFRATPTTRVVVDHRYLALQGAGRMAVVGTYERNGTRGLAFHTYSYPDFFSALAAAADMVAITAKRPGMHERALHAAHDIHRRIKLYFNVINALIIGIAVAFYVYGERSQRELAVDPVIEASADAVGGFDLAAALREKATLGRPAIIVAASGGGTRAALYTANALRGIARLKRADDIVLMSGVSGGGVALAYFAGHPRTHAAGLLNAGEWKLFRNGMAAPFIGDVLEGAMEWRILGPTPLTALLAESFGRRLGKNARADFGQIVERGLILNTTIAGHPREDSALVSNALGVGGATPDPVPENLAYAHLRGSRLVFTNLRNVGGFPRLQPSTLPDGALPYVVVSDPSVSILEAAALTANFPPVFPNALVDLRPDRYFVTDGGATENLGLLSALYALRAALDEICGTASCDAAALPPIHLVALEASFVAFDYEQDRGLGAATDGAKTRLASQLTEVLLAQLTARIPSLQVHYLPMPLLFRSRGGVGTHWMLPSTIALQNPHLPRRPNWRSEIELDAWGEPAEISMDRLTLLDLLDRLHERNANFCGSPHPLPGKAARVTTGWICGVNTSGLPAEADPHLAAWRRLVKLLEKD